MTCSCQDQEIERLKRMVRTAGDHLRDLLPFPCGDHDCTDHAWWDPGCDHFGCTMINP